MCLPQPCSGNLKACWEVEGARNPHRQMDQDTEAACITCTWVAQWKPINAAELKGSGGWTPAAGVSQVQAEESRKSSVLGDALPSQVGRLSATLGWR